MLNILSDSVNGTSYIFVSISKLGKLEKLCRSLPLVALISVVFVQIGSSHRKRIVLSISIHPPPPGQLQQTVFHCKITNHPMGEKYRDAHGKF